MKTKGIPIPFFLMFLLAGCSDSPGSPEDAGMDAGVDAGVDAGNDAGVDAGVDAGLDAGTDAGTDAGLDAGEDAGVDAGADAGEDGGDQPGDGDEEPSPWWPWCPQASDYLGGDWAVTLQATEEALYCATFDEARTLEQEYHAKSRLRFIPGDYPLPETNGTYPFVLPVCFEFRDLGTQPEILGVGEILANHTIDANGTTYRFTITQPMRTASGEDWIWEASLHGFNVASGVFVLDGSWLEPFDAEFWFYSRLCLNDCNQWLDVRWFDSCRFENANPQKHTLVFDGGQVEWHILMGWSAASTEPALYNQAVGSLDGVAFDQQDYYLLIYNPAHHHFTRTFAVLFDAPISGACGLKAFGLEPWPGGQASRLTTINCDLSEIGERTILNETFENKK